MAQLFNPDAYYRNGVSFPASNQNKQEIWREPNSFNFHENNPPFAQDMNNLTPTFNKPTPQILSKNALSMANNNGIIHSSEARRDSGTHNSKEVATNVGVHTNITGKIIVDVRKIKSGEKRRFKRLLREGVPQEKAHELAVLPWQDIERLLLRNPQKIKNSKELQGPENKTSKMSAGTDKPKTTLGTKDKVPIKDAGLTKSVGPMEDIRKIKDTLLNKDAMALRVGITNSKPMTEEQMKLLHRHLILAITKVCSDSAGPEFLGFSHKTGWVLVTCVNQRSKDWLVCEVPYLEPWCGAQLSVIPEMELPQPPRAIIFIPDCEGVSVEEATHLLRVQNKGLNTELWKVRCQRVKEDGKIVSFTIDDPSADALREQNYQAHLGFALATFKIKGQYKSYTPSATKNLATATQNQTTVPSPSSKPHGSQSHDVWWNSFNKTREVTISRKEGTVQHFLPSSQLSPISEGSGGITDWEEPAALAAEAQPMPQGRDFGAQSFTQKSQGCGKTLIQPSLGESITGGLSTSGRGLVPLAAGSKPTTQPVIRNFPSGIPYQHMYEHAGGKFGLDGLATREKSSEKGDSTSHIGASYELSTINQDKFSSQASGGHYQARNNSPSCSGTFTLDKSWGTANELLLQGKGAFGIPNSLSEKTPLTQSRSRVGSIGAVGAQTQGFQRRRDESFNQDRNAMDLIVSDSDERSNLSPDAEGGYKSWVIEDPDSYAGRINQEPETRTLTSVSPFASYGDQRHTQFDLGSTANREMILDGVPSLATGDYGTWIIGSESYTSFQGNRPVTYQDSGLSFGLLPDPSFSQSRIIEPESHSSFQGNWVTDRETMLDKVYHEARGFGGVVQNPESHGKPLHSDRGIVEQGSRSRRGHPSKERCFQSSNATDQESRSNRRSSQARSGSGGRRDPDSHRRSFRDASNKGNVADRESRSNRRSSPHARSDGQGRLHSDSHGRSSRDDKGNVANREARSNRRSSPHARSGYGGRSGPDSHGRSFRDSRGLETERESRSNRRPSPYARSGGRSHPATHGRTFRDSRRN